MPKIVLNKEQCERVRSSMLFMAHRKHKLKRELDNPASWVEVNEQYYNNSKKLFGHYEQRLVLLKKMYYDLNLFNNYFNVEPQ